MKILNRNHRHHDVLGFHDEVTRLFDELSRPATRGWLPAVDVQEDDDAYRFLVDLPGIDPKLVKIEMSADTLSFKGERKAETAEPGKGVAHRVERVSGSFERSFRLGLPVDSAKIKATYRDGVLDIVVPKLEQAKTREIAIDV